MALVDIVRANAARCTDVTVTTDSGIGWVEIADDTGEHESIFLQGDDAYELHLALPYSENLWN